eukprot:c21562_g1_i1 orf=106-780(-)
MAKAVVSPWTTVVLAVILAVWQWRPASAATFTVGGSLGWDLGVNYGKWSQGKTFTKGDALYFPYMQASHSVLEVSKSNYDTCSTANPISNDDGAGNTRITLSKIGNHYFMCGVEGHCRQGMKLAINVASTSTIAPSPSPASSPSKSRSPSPASSPSQSPSPAPSTMSPNPAMASLAAPTRRPSTSPSPVGSPSTTHSAAPIVEAAAIITLAAALTAQIIVSCLL